VEKKLNTLSQRGSFVGFLFFYELVAAVGELIMITGVV
jgi:hypothetical protein